MSSQGARGRSRSPRRADPTARARSRSPRPAGNVVESSPVPTKIASAKLEILRAILEAARDPELSARQLHDFLSCASNLQACPANLKTGCQDGAEDKITRDEIDAAECVAIPNRSGTPNCINISSLGHTWAGKQVTVNPFNNTYLEGPFCSVKGQDFPRNQAATSDTDDQQEATSDMDYSDSEAEIEYDSSPPSHLRPAPASPTVTPYARRRAALERQDWVEAHLRHLGTERRSEPGEVGDENWMAEARFQREEREIQKEIRQLDRELQDYSARMRAETRRELRTEHPRLRAHRRKIASIKDALVAHISRMQTTRNLPLSFRQRAREWVYGRERYLESLKQKLSEAEAEERRLVARPH